MFWTFFKWLMFVYLFILYAHVSEKIEPKGKYEMEL